MKVLSVLQLIVCFGLVMLSMAGCDDDDAAGPVIHEWGVMFGCADDTAFTVTCRPPTLDLPVREPVIYVHWDKGRVFSARVEFQTGEPTLTYPPANVDGQTVRWDSVVILPEPMPVKQSPDSTLIPIQDITPVLNEVDADVLGYGEYSPRFLFYEGRLNYTSTVTAEFASGADSVTLFNDGPFTVYDLLVVRPYEWNPGSSPLALYLDSLLPGQQVHGTLDLEQLVNLGGRLTALGFTAPEATAFWNLWHTPIYGLLESDPVGILTYRLPQLVYDTMFPLTIVPAPAETIRAMFVLIRIAHTLPG